MQLPHAEEIRAARAELERGASARQWLAKMEAALIGLALGDPRGDLSAARDALALAFPDLDLSGDPADALGRARAVLHADLMAAERAGHALHALAEAQSHALEAPEYAEIRAELQTLAGERSALHASMAVLTRTVAVLGPLRTVALNQQAACAAWERAGRPPEIVEARVRTTVERITAQLGRLELGGTLGNPIAATGLEALAETARRLGAAEEHARDRLGELQSKATEIEERIRSRTG